MNNFIIGLTVVVAMCVGLNEACAGNFIEIHNHLPPGLVLRVHCRYKNRYDDVGVQFLRNNTTPLTLRSDDPLVYYKRPEVNCYLLYRSKFNQSFHVEIEAYRAAARPRCGQYRSWTAKKDGIYFTRYRGKPSELRYQWIPKIK